MLLKFYHREDCHLCEQALELLGECGLIRDLVRVDIDSDPALGVEFGLRIPVLERADGVCLDWPFDDDVVGQFMK